MAADRLSVQQMYFSRKDLVNRLVCKHWGEERSCRGSEMTEVEVSRRKLTQITLQFAKQRDESG